jgi:hypothetical protein
MPYTPKESMDALKYFYRDRGADLWGPFGFYDAFNVKQNWYADSYLAIDQGPIICMIENHRSGLLWEKFMANPEIGPALTAIGFVDDPFAINDPGYDSNMVSFSCYPNPADEETILFVECKNEVKMDITIVNPSGQKVRSLYSGLVCHPGIHRIITGLEGIPQGLYFIYLSNDQHILAIDKLIKQ